MKDRRNNEECIHQGEIPEGEEEKDVEDLVDRTVKVVHRVQSCVEVLRMAQFTEVQALTPDAPLRILWDSLKSCFKK